GINFGPYHWLIIKYNTNGIQQWVKYFYDPIGGDDEPLSIVIDKEQNIYVAGAEQVNVQGFDAALLLKYKPNGDTLWGRRYASWDYNGYSKVKLDATGKVYTGGAVQSNTTGNVDQLIVKYDTAGV